MPVNEAFVDDEGILTNESPNPNPVTNMEENNGPTTDAAAVASNPGAPPPPATETETGIAAANNDDKNTKTEEEKPKEKSKSKTKKMRSYFCDKGWIRKLFLTAADLAYPGIVDVYGREQALKQKRQVVASEVKTSLRIQMLLNAELRYLVVWIGYYLWNIRSTFWSLKYVHGQIYCIVFGTFILTNLLRLVAGKAGNRTDNTPKLAAYWFTTILIQPPQLFFLMLSNILNPCPRYQLIATDIVLSVLIISEIFIVFFHVQTLLKGEVELLRKETDEIANKNK